MTGPIGYQPQDTVNYGQPSFPEQSQAIVVLIFGLAGMFMFPLLAPFAWFMGNRELAAIDAGRRSPDNRQLAKVGQILGIVMMMLTVLIVLGVVLLVAA